MAIDCTINDIQRDILAGSLSINWKLGARGSADFTLDDPAAVPSVGQGVALFQGGTRIWSGSIDDVNKQLLANPSVAEYRYRIRAVTLEQRLDFILVKPPKSTSDPSSTYIALSGTCNVTGTTVVRLTGDPFDFNLDGTKIVIDGTTYTVGSVTDEDHITLTASAGTLANKAFAWTPTAGNIFRSILAYWLNGENIGIGTIEDGDDVGKQVYDYHRISDIFQSLADATGFIWYIDAERTLNYHVRTTATGVAITAADVLIETAPEVTTTREELVNAQYERISHSALSPSDAIFAGNGVDVVFSTGYPIAIMQAGTIEESGAFREATFGQRGTDTGKDFYYGYGERKISQDAAFSGTITDVTDATPVEVTFSAAHGLATGHYVFLAGVTAALNRGWRVNVTATDKVTLVDSEASGSFTSGTATANQPIATGDYLRFTYRKLGADVIDYADGTAIAARSATESNSGRYERLEENTSSTDAAGALTLAQAIVDARKNPSSVVRFLTEDSSYRPGQLVNITVSQLGLSGNYLIDEVNAHDDGSPELRFMVSAVDGNGLGGWRSVFSALKGGTSSSGLFNVSGGTAIATNPDTGTTTAAAGNVTGVSLVARITDKKPEILVTYTKPSPVGTFDGIVLYYENADQSNLPAATADGGTLADGTSNAGGEWHPILVTKKKHVDGEPVVFQIDEEVKESRTVRVYVNSYNTADVENALVRASESGETPSATVTISPISIGAQGEEYCKNPTDTAIDSNEAVFEGAVLVRHVKTSWAGPEGGSGVYVEIPYTDADGNEQVNVAVGVGGHAENWFPDPKTEQTVSIRFRGFVDQFPGVEDDLVNTYVDGITPELTASIGATTGTVDLGEGIAATVAASMAVLNKVLGVSTNGITEDLIATFAVSQAKLENAQIIDAARIVDDAVTNAKLADLSVDTAQMVNGSVDNSKLGALAVDAANLATSAVTSTKIANLAVGNAAIANLAVGTSKMQLLSVDTTIIANAAITNAKIGALAVASANIQDLAVSTAKIADTAITTAKIANAAITNALIANLAVGTAHIQDLAVTDAKIASLSVGKLQAGTIAVALTLTVGGSEQIVIDPAQTGLQVKTSGVTRWTMHGGGLLGNDTAGSNTIVLNNLSKSMTLFDSGSEKVFFSATLMEMRMNGQKILGTRGAAVADPSGGAVVDVECRAQLAALLSRVRASTGHGLIS